MGERKLRYKPNVVTNIVNACAVLHNILVKANVPYNEEVVIEHIETAEALPTTYNSAGQVKRRQYAETLHE